MKTKYNNSKVSSPELIAYCGLYCANCGKFKKGGCPGCKKNEKLSWCKIRACCKDLELAHCGECSEFKDPKQCPKYNNLISRVIELFSGSDRSKCIGYLRKHSTEEFISMMNENGKMSLSKKR
jgi:hypothetical protein